MKYDANPRKFCGKGIHGEIVKNSGDYNTWISKMTSVADYTNILCSYTGQIKIVQAYDNIAKLISITTNYVRKIFGLSKPVELQDEFLWLDR